MSNNILKIIFQDPCFVPSQASLERVTNELAVYLSKRKEDIQVKITDEVRFVDPGANLHEIKCNFCSSIIDIEWWQEAVDQVYEGHFKSLTVITPCCHQVTSLNSLVYDWTAGFARLSIEIFDPKVDLTQEQQNKLETILGTEIRKIWSHY